MVDSIKGTGPVHNISSAKQHEAGAHKRVDEKRKSEEPKDEVLLSQEALDLSQAEKAASDVRAELEKNNLTLGLNKDFDKKV